MTNTFLKRRGGGGGEDGCRRRDGLWAFSFDYCWASGAETTQDINGLHSCIHTHLDTHTHMLWCLCDLSWLMSWLFDSVWCVSAGVHKWQSCLERPSAAATVCTRPTLDRLQLLGNDDCDGNSSWWQGQKKKKREKGFPCSVEKRPLRNCGLSLGEGKMPDDAVKRWIKKNKPW